MNEDEKISGLIPKSDIDKISPHSQAVIRIGGQEIVLDNSRLAFNEVSLNVFMENLALWYDYFSQKLAEAEAILAYKEYEYDVFFSSSYERSKEDGCTDKLAEANAKKDPNVCDAKKEIIVAKHKVTLLKQHLKAWDKAHENAMSRGHMVRKEMDKLNTDIMFKGRDDRVGEIVGKKWLSE
jgi:hypothetical protein